jgi:S1-C subfamily serine protease
MRINKIQKEAWGFSPRAFQPNTGESPLTDKSVIPTNNIYTFEDALKGKPYKIPGAGGNWSEGEDVSKDYREDGDMYKREERDLSILRKMMQPSKETGEKWKVKVPGGSRIFPSFNLVQKYREQMEQKGVPIQWVSRIAKKDRTGVISDSLRKTFKIESIDTFQELKEIGSCFCIAPNYFLTCAHVITKYNIQLGETLDVEDFKGRVEISINYNGRKVPAELIAINGAWDIAIVKADIYTDIFELDTHSVTVGDDILTIGSPHGFENNASFGNVGSLGNNIYSHKDAAKYMIIDAPVFPGNSGGPIVKESNGEVVGMLTSIVAKNSDYGLNIGISALYLKKFCSTYGIIVD